MATPPSQITAIATTWNNTGLTVTSSSVTVQTGDVIIIRGMSADGAVTLNTPTNSGTAQTYTLRQSVVVASYSTAYLWTAIASVGQSMTVTVTATNTAVQSYGFRVSVYRGSDGIGATAKTNIASGAPSLALTTTGANSAVECSNSDWAAADGTTRTWRTVNGAPMTEQGYYRDAAQYTNYSGWRADTGAAGAQTLGLSAPAGQKYSMMGVEILGTASAAPNYPFGITTPTPRYR